METLIRVELKDGSICRMAVKAFNVFLAHGKIAKFERADGWVVIGRDRLRDLDRSVGYDGPDRRLAV